MELSFSSNFMTFVVYQKQGPENTLGKNCSTVRDSVWLSIRVRVRVVCQFFSGVGGGEGNCPRTITNAKAT